MIADAMAHGKKVLLVSQKRAALDVVHKRLGALGLLDVRAEEPGVGPDVQAETILAIPVPDPERKFGKLRSVCFMLIAPASSIATSNPAT